MMDDPYRNLANAIIVQAAKDYRKALRQLKRNPKYDAAKNTKNEVERFFHSEWFRFLTDADPDYLLDRITRAEL
jgi:hypothetical protein